MKKKEETYKKVSVCQQFVRNQCKDAYINNRGTEMTKTLDIGNLTLLIGKEFKLEGNTLTVRFGATINQVAEFLEKAKQ